MLENSFRARRTSNLQIDGRHINSKTINRCHHRRRRRQQVSNAGASSSMRLLLFVILATPSSLLHVLSENVPTLPSEKDSNRFGIMFDAQRHRRDEAFASNTGFTLISNQPTSSPSLPEDVSIDTSLAFVKRSSRPSSSPSAKPIKRRVRRPSARSEPASPSARSAPASPSARNSAPTRVPSDVPSTLPSTRPSLSAHPSISTAPSLSNQPSHRPSLAPSTSTNPTAFPSLQCHDLSSYQSPINGFECSHHNGTDCFSWRFLGLEPMDVETLITSCPVSCQIPCGSLLSFENNITLQLLHVDNFLAPESTRLVEQVSAEFLTEYGQSKNADSRFLIYEAELLSQRMLDSTENGDPSRRQRRQRSSAFRTLQERKADLEVSMAFRGFVLDSSLGTVETYLLEGIQNFGYTRTLRFTNDPALQEVQVALELFSSDAVDIDPGTSPADVSSGSSRDEEDPSLVLFLVVSLVAIAGVIAMAVAMHRNIRRNNSLSPSDGATSIIGMTNQPSDKDLDSQVASPAGSTRSFLANTPTRSFDSVLRFVSTSLSPKSKTSSPAATVAASVGDVTIGTTDKSSAGSSSHGKVNPVPSLECSESLDADDHPLSGVIPPMIVYDCIDDGDDNERGSSSNNRSLRRSMSPTQRVVPSKQKAATPTFRAALHGHSRSAIDESTFAGILQHSLSDTEEGAVVYDVVTHATSYPCAPRTDPGVSKSNSMRSLHCVRTSLDDLAQPTSSTARRLSASFQDVASTTSAVASEEDETVSDATTVKTGAGGRDSPDGSMASASAAVASAAAVSQSTIWKISPRRNLVRKQSQLSVGSGATDQLAMENSATDWHYVMFDAPQGDNLGLSLRHVDGEVGNVVSRVEDYSPLLGQVQEGDRIIDIDRITTKGLELQQVTSYLNGELAAPGSEHLKHIRIGVLRARSKERHGQPAAAAPAPAGTTPSRGSPKSERGRRRRSLSRASTRSATPPPPPASVPPSPALRSPKSMTTPPRSYRKGPR